MRRNCLGSFWWPCRHRCRPKSSPRTSYADCKRGSRSSVLIAKIRSSEITFDVDTETMLELQTNPALFEGRGIACGSPGFPCPTNELTGQPINIQRVPDDVANAQDQVIISAARRAPPCHFRAPFVSGLIPAPRSKFLFFYYRDSSHVDFRCDLDELRESEARESIRDLFLEFVSETELSTVPAK